MHPRSRAVLLTLLLAAGGGSCLAPRDTGEQGTAEEFGRMLSEDGAEPVYGEEGTSLGPPPEGNPDPEPDVAALAADQEAEPEPAAPPVVPINPYLRFGERILVREQDGVQFVTKPYPLPPGKAAKVIELLDALEPFDYAPRPPAAADTGRVPPPRPDLIEYQILAGWDEEHYAKFTNPEGHPLPDASGPTPVVLSDLLVVTATPQKLADFEEFLDTFAASVPQIELEAKIIEIVETDTTDIGIRPIDAATDIFTFGSSNFVKGFNFDLGNQTDPTEALLTLGGIHDGVAFNAIIEAVKSWQNVTIESRPKSVVRAGGVARLDSTQEIPFFSVKSVTPNGGFNATTEYKEVGVKLYIAPRVVGSKMLALDLHLEGSQVVGFQRIITQTDGDPGTPDTNIDVPIIAYRTAKTVVYLEPGQTLVLGGLTRERQRDVQHKVPILGDLPLLGFFFRSTFEEVEREHVIFAVSPRIVQKSELLNEL